MRNLYLIFKTTPSPSISFAGVWLLAILIIFMAEIVSAQNIDTLWSETWEGVWVENWYSDGGTWEAGIPSSGPATAYKDSNCAATVLAGNYSEGVRSRLVKIAKFTVPSADLNPRLRFWHWFSFSSSDYGYVQLKVGAGDWINISAKYSGVSSSVWTCPSLDLSAYADSLVQIAFYFHSDNYAGGSIDVSSGWYIDNISLLYGPVTFNTFEDFESGLGDWASERGTWQIGIPESGPDSVYSGSICAGTRLDDAYSEGVRSRLISPEFTVPAANTNPRLRFWHWFSLSTSDYGTVQIRIEDGEWQDISSSLSATCSNVWTYPSIDLSAYADSLVQIAFYFQSDNYAGGSIDVSSGWYIDDVQIITGPYIFNTPEGFETGIGDWSAERGTWEVGRPSSGPLAAYTGEICLATKLDGNYSESVRSNFISPPFQVESVDNSPSLRFWHWYSFSSSDYGEVYIKTENRDWELISTRFSGTSSNVWTNFYADLSAYADSLVQIAFYFHSDNYAGGSVDVSSGWYIDEVSIPTSLTALEYAESTLLPKTYTLEQNYPNPFNPNTIINYELPITNYVDLSVYNLLGQKIAVIVSETQPAGSHQVIWNGIGFANGIYYYRISAGEWTDVKKMILLR